MATNRVPHLFYGACPVLYGDFTIQRYFEQPPQAYLTIQYIPNHKLQDYLNTYADKTKIYSFFESFFVVESYQVSNQRVMDDTPLLIHNLAIVYKSYIQHKGENLFIPKTASVGDYDRANANAIAGLANLSIVGEISPIKLNTPDEFEEGITLNLLDTLILYSRIQQSYVDFNYRNQIRIFKKHVGQNRVLQNSKEYLLEYYETKKNTPLMLYKAKTPPLYENYDDFFLSQRYRFPSYVLQPLNYRRICRYVYETTDIENQNNTFKYNYYLNPAYLEYLRQTPTSTVVCSLYYGQNLISEELKTTIQHRLLNSTYSYSGPAGISNLNASVPEYVVVEEYISQYIYTYFDINTLFNGAFNSGGNSPMFPRIKIYDGRNVYYVKITPISPPIQQTVRILTGINTVSTSRQRLHSRGYILDDLIELGQEWLNLVNVKSNAQTRLNQYLSLPASVRDTIEEADIRLTISKANVEIMKNLELRKMADYVKAEGRERSEFIIKPYVIRNQDLLYGSVIKERPQVMGIPAIEVDLEGYGYYLLPDPNWVPPLFIANESVRFRAESAQFLPPEWFDVYFAKAYEFFYLNTKFNYYQNVYTSWREALGLNEEGASLAELTPSELSGMRGAREQMEAARQRQIEIARMYYPNPISLRRYSNTTTTRTLLEEYETTIDPITQQQKRIRVDAYQETVFEETWKAPDNLKFQKTTTTTNFAKPPSPVFWVQPYIPIDYDATTDDKYIYFVSTTNNPLPNWIEYAERYIDLPQFPTTSWQVYRVALITYIEILNFLKESTFDIKLFGMHHYLLPGDYLRILDIPELSASNLRILGVSFTINFQGLDETNQPLAICDETTITLGSYNSKTIEHSSKRLPKAGASYDFDL